MERNTIAEMKAIIDAIEQGKAIQWYNASKDKWDDTTNNRPNFCDSTYRIKPEAKETLLTNRELAKWLAQGNGELTREDWKDSLTVLTSCVKNVEDKPADDGWLIRKWDDTEWHKPTREYAFVEVKNES